MRLSVCLARVFNVLLKDTWIQFSWKSNAFRKDIYVHWLLLLMLLLLKLCASIQTSSKWLLLLLWAKTFHFFHYYGQFQQLSRGINLLTVLDQNGNGYQIKEIYEKNGCNDSWISKTWHEFLFYRLDFHGICRHQGKMLFDSFFSTRPVFFLKFLPIQIFTYINNPTNLCPLRCHY